MKAMNRDDEVSLKSTTTEMLLVIMEELLEQPLRSMNMREYYHEVMDIDRSTSEECLHLAVYTPVDLRNQGGISNSVTLANYRLNNTQLFRLYQC